MTRRNYTAIVCESLFARQNEEWRAIVGHEGLYEISDRGRVRSLYHTPARPMVIEVDADGYLTVRLSKGGIQRKHRLHRLVCETFNGPGNILHCEVAHLDGDRTNARPDNLKWVSRVENCSHKRLHGTHRRGHFILSLEQVERIKLREGTAKELGRRYGVSSHAIYDIWQGKRWVERNPGYSGEAQ